LRFLVKNVKVFTRDPYSNKIYQYLIEGRLKSGLRITLFDFKRFNLKDYEDQQIEVLVFALVAIDRKTSEFERIKGKFKNGCSDEFAREWLKYEPDLSLDKYSALKTQDGIFLINHLNLDYFTIDYEDNLIVDIVRFDLFAWHSIEK